MSEAPDPQASGRATGSEGRPRRGPNRVRRGDVRAAVLALLAEADMHGYQIIQELAERSDGRWRPGAGSIYPTLHQLQEQGFIRSRPQGSRRVFSITEYGRRSVNESGDAAPWRAYAQDKGPAAKLREATRTLHVALAQVEQSGTQEEVERAGVIINQGRRSVYLMLAGEGS